MPTNPFKRHDKRADSDFSDVVVPLPASRRRGSLTASVQSEEGAMNLRDILDAELSASGVNSIYDRKSKLVNLALADVGMGKYNWELFCLAGFGWFADNLWLQAVAVALPGIQREWGVPSNQIGYVTTSLFVGLCIGATVWGVASDIIGRRLAFNMTLFLAGVFGIAAGAAPTFVGVAGLLACVGTGIGGNLPVDGALFLEFLPQASGNLLTLLSVWWPVGQLVASLLGWALVPNFTCASETGPCEKSTNMGWRYFLYTIGALTFVMFVCRFFFFHLYESPKYLLSRGRDEDAVRVVQSIARKNKSKTWLTMEVFTEVCKEAPASEKDLDAAQGRAPTAALVRQNLSKFSLSRVKSLFHTRRLAATTCLIWLMWATIGMAYPLFNAFLPLYLQNAGGSQPTSTYIVYRNYAIISIVGVPGSIIACYTVDLKYIGRKGTMAISTLLTGIFLFLFTISNDSNVQLGFSCLVAFFQNAEYGVLYAYTPEVFPAPVRGTGTGIASLLNRIFGLCAPIIATNSIGTNPKVPIYVSGALTLVACVAMVVAPIETMGRQRL